MIAPIKRRMYTFHFNCLILIGIATSIFGVGKWLSKIIYFKAKYYCILSLISWNMEKLTSMHVQSLYNTYKT